MGWFWADKSSSISTSGLCPVAHVKKPSESICPVDHSKFKSSNSGDNACPVKYDGEEVLNPLNNMPMSISSERAPGQKVVLSTEKTVSTIPRGDSEDQGLWVYPSPQQMYNAMLRKGKSGGISEDSVESMVEVHNFLNEGAWQQILQWESEYTKNTKVEPRLLKFMGRPGDLSPRAQMYLWLGKLFPATFNTQPPFDRHDWTILRSLGRNKGWKEVRYVIDYYSAQDDEETGMPAFMLDTRPALDSSSSAYDRFQHWSQPLWKKAMGKFDEL